MRRALRLGLFIGTLIGMSACAATDPGFTPGAYGSGEIGRTD